VRPQLNTGYHYIKHNFILFGVLETHCPKNNCQTHGSKIECRDYSQKGDGNTKD